MAIRIRCSWLAGSLLLLSCGDLSGPLSLDAETAALRELEARIAPRLGAAFGERARLQRVYGTGSRVLLGVALEPPVPESDIVPPVAFAALDRDSGALEVVAEEVAYREALPLGDHLAVVTTTGDLVLRGRDGSERLLARGVRGDLAKSADGKRLALTLGAPNREHETAVAIVDLTGGLDGELDGDLAARLSVIADGPGVDDRPALSPDGETVVFVSGRTGIASFYRTTLAAEPPVQLTNAHIQPGVPRRVPPEGFVPPPVVGDRVEWLSEDVLRYDAGGGAWWTLNIRTGRGAREALDGGAK